MGTSRCRGHAGRDAAPPSGGRAEALGTLGCARSRRAGRRASSETAGGGDENPRAARGPPAGTQRLFGADGRSAGNLCCARLPGGGAPMASVHRVRLDDAAVDGQIACECCRRLANSARLPESSSSPDGHARRRELVGAEVSSTALGNLARKGSGRQGAEGCRARHHKRTRSSVKLDSPLLVP